MGICHVLHGCGVKVSQTASERGEPKEGYPTDVPEMAGSARDSGAPIAGVGLSRGARVPGAAGL